MPRGSTKKTCPFCLGILFCAQKICAHCLKEQPKKQRLEKKLKRFDEKREDWVSGRKKNNNIGSIKDEAIILLEKLHAIGFKPVLLLCKETKKKKKKCEILTPRCTLSAYAQDYLEKIGTFYEFLCKGWTQDSTGQGVAEDPDEERVTLNLTPCDPSEPESQVLETSTVQVEVLKTPPVKQCTTTEVGQEEQSQQDMEVEQATENVTQATTTEGPDLCAVGLSLDWLQ
ncbi:D-glycero-beta-D-manno-heptose-17-bisphosphate 7-phosphatase [Dissostichus eleginoides]|uniref:D-glycero-beta-D-manno-heptose-17-bisphosphate 7-phosphatase n=1 Tax=Dissostichus eleginoides TaxID=100907 RepID=A0AAD9FD03_DISEL|nr:D-glycero-beta-D-manno-heptose-17-bisphosphate 7-phosphatase [Dissostichus eleginoides]